MTIPHALQRPARQSGRLGRRRPPEPTCSPVALPPRPPTAETLWLRFKRLTQFGWPRSFPIVQFPNAPLIIAFLAGEAASLGHGWGHAGAAAVSYLAMGIWAYGELFHGVNWFRHLLGLTYLISTTVHLALALQR
jgi:hypothetical protein